MEVILEFEEVRLERGAELEVVGEMISEEVDDADEKKPRTLGRVAFGVQARKGKAESFDNDDNGFEGIHDMNRGVEQSRGESSDCGCEEVITAELSAIISSDERGIY